MKVHFQIAERSLFYLNSDIHLRQIAYPPERDEADGEEDHYHLSFCGYFPSEDPQYSMIVSLNKKGLPASGGGMAGPVFRQTVEFICDRKSK